MNAKLKKILIGVLFLTTLLSSTINTKMIINNKQTNIGVTSILITMCLIITLYEVTQK